MPGQFDDTLKHLTELSPQDWVLRGGWTPAPAALIDADIATLTGATDKVIRVAGPPDWQAHQRLFFFGNYNLPKKVTLSAQMDAQSGAPYNVTTGTVSGDAIHLLATSDDALTDALEVYRQELAAQARAQDRTLPRN